MSKVLLFVLTVTYLSLSTVLSQDNFVAISIEWQLGDKKKVTTVSSEIMLMNGVEILNTSSTGVYTIEVVDTVDFFTLVYQQKKTDIDFNLSLSQDTSNREITEYIHQLIELTSDVSYTIRVDKDTGEPIEVLNEDEIIEQIKGITKKILPKLELDTTDSMFSSFNETVMDEVVGSVHSQIMQTILNSCNMLTQAYSYSFLINDSYTQEFLVYDFNALGEFADVDFPAEITISSKEFNKGKKIVVETSIQYDKTFLLDQMKKVYPQFSDFTENDIEIIENESYYFDMNTTWITKNETYIKFRAGDILVETNETVVIE